MGDSESDRCRILLRSNFLDFLSALHDLVAFFKCFVSSRSYFLLIVCPFLVTIFVSLF